jgi:hypothetical protein
MMEEGGIGVWKSISTSSGDGDSLLTQTAVEVNAAFSFCDSGDKSASFCLWKAWTGYESNFFNNATGDFAEDVVTSSTASSSASSSSLRRKSATLLTFQAPLTLITVFDYLTVFLDAQTVIALEITSGSAIFK